MEKVGVSPDGNRAAVTSFSESGRYRIHCSFEKNQKTFLEEIRHLDQKGEYTNMEDGLAKGKIVLMIYNSLQHYKLMWKREDYSDKRKHGFI